MLATRNSRLAKGLSIADSVIAGSDGFQIPVRTYQISTNNNPEFSVEPNENLVIYYHGGGLFVGDLDSEDLSCRRICKETSSTVISIDYRLMPNHQPHLAVQDAWEGFKAISTKYAPKTLVVVGSSSGGQLAAQVSQCARADIGTGVERDRKEIDGLLLRCPVTCDPTNNGIHLPPRFKEMHGSFSPSFETSLVRLDPGWMKPKAPNLPLEADAFDGLPRTFFQQCTNDIFYSDGVCYAQALVDAGVEVRVDVLDGWPHTFWLKAPQLERALEAEQGMIDGLLWLQGNL